MSEYPFINKTCYAKFFLAITLFAPMIKILNIAMGKLWMKKYNISVKSGKQRDIFSFHKPGKTAKRIIGSLEKNPTSEFEKHSSHLQAIKRVLMLRYFWIF